MVDTRGITQGGDSEQVICVIHLCPYFLVLREGLLRKIIYGWGELVVIRERFCLYLVAF